MIHEIKKVIYFTIFFWFLTENLFMDMVSWGVEIQTYFSPSKRHLISAPSLISISSIWISIKIVGFVLFVIFTTKHSSKLYYLHLGLSEKWCKLVIYYIHFLFIWLLIALLVLFTPFSNSIVVVSLLLGLFVVSLIINCFKLFRSKLLLFQILLARELNLLTDTSILLAL